MTDARHRRGATLLTLVLAAGLVSGCRGEDRPTVLEARDERIPNFAATPTVQSVGDGRWSEPSTWAPARIPRDGDIVAITAGTTVTYDVVSEAGLDAIGVAGELAFDPTRSARLEVTHLLVYQDGTLRIGDASHPVSPDATVEIVFRDVPLELGTAADPGRDPFQYGNGALVWGDLIVHGADRGAPFIRLMRGLRAGETDVPLAARPVRWRAGDEVFLPDSRLRLAQGAGDGAPPAAPHDDHWEIGTIGAVDGTGLTLAGPLEHDHPSAVDTTGETVTVSGQPLAPHAANLSRNVVFRSANPDGIRGHTIGFRGATVRIAHARFEALGRTTAAPLDDTRADPGGGIAHIGRNQAARYPLHLHHVTTSPAIWTEDDHPTFEIRGVVIVDAPRWGLSVHGSHFGVVADTIVVDADGAGIVTEDGSETGNRFERNFVSAIRGTGEAIDARRAEQGLGHEGAGFWLGSDNNHVVENVAAGVGHGGFTLFRSEAARLSPSRSGGDDGDDRPRLFSFIGNEVYGAGETGIELWDSKSCQFCELGGTTLRDTTVWHSPRGVTFDYHADYYAVDGLLVHGTVHAPDGTVGISANQSRTASLKNLDLRYVAVGIDAGGGRNRQIEIDGAGMLARVGLRIRRSGSWGPGQHFTARRVTITPLDEGGQLVELDPRPFEGRRFALSVRRPIRLVSFQGREGQDYQLFYEDQAADHVMPQDDHGMRGCPTAALTNAQCLLEHGVSIGGAIALCEGRLAGIDGFACPES